MTFQALLTRPGKSSRPRKEVTCEPLVVSGQQGTRCDGADLVFYPMVFLPRKGGDVEIVHRQQVVDDVRALVKNGGGLAETRIRKPVGTPNPAHVAGEGVLVRSWEREPGCSDAACRG